MGWHGVASSADGNKSGGDYFSSGGIYTSTNSGAIWTQTSASIPRVGRRRFVGRWNQTGGSRRKYYPPLNYNREVYLSTNSGGTWIAGQPAQHRMGIGRFFGGWNQIDGWGLHRNRRLWNLYLDEFGSHMDFKQCVPIWFKLVFGRHVSGWNQAGGSRLGRRRFCSGLDLHLIGFRSHLANKRCATKNSGNRLASSADGGKLVAAVGYGRRPLHLANHTGSAVEPRAVKRQSHRFLDYSLYEFRDCSRISDLASNWTEMTNKPALNLTNLQNEVTSPMSSAAAFTGSKHREVQMM